MGFLDNHFDFFHPRTCNLDPQFPAKQPLETREGITSVDFPIHDFIIALVMKITGYTEPVLFRGYILLYGLTGLFFLFLLVKQFTSSSFSSLFAVVFVFTAPVYTYYQAGFLPTIPSFANTIIGYYFFFNYLRRENKKDFFLAIFFFTLAALARTPFAIFLIAVMCQLSIAWLKNKKISWTEISACMVSIATIGFYFLYNRNLSTTYGTMYLGAFMPAENIQAFQEIIRNVYDRWGGEYFTGYHYLFLVIGLPFAIFSLLFYKVKLKKEEIALLFQITVSFMGSALYFIAMARQFVDHDYYFIDSFFIPFVLLVLFIINFLPQKNNLSKGFFFAAGCVLAFLCVTRSQEIQAARYTAPYWDRTEIIRQNFTGSEKFLDSLNIDKAAKILVLDAGTPYTPLLLMGRKGYTVLTTDKEHMNVAMNFDFDYVAFQDDIAISAVIGNYPEIINRLEKIADNGKISLYKKCPRPCTKDLKTFLGITPGKTLYRHLLNFDSDSVFIGWSNTDKVTPEAAGLKSKAAMLSEDIEFGATLKIKAGSLNLKGGERIFITADIFFADAISQLQVVAAVSNHGGQYYYNSYNAGESVEKPGEWKKAEFQFCLPVQLAPEDELGLYFWNPGKNKIYYDDLEVVIYD